MLVLLCAGQGTQHADMFRVTGDWPAAAPLFAAASALLGEDPRSFVQHAAPAELYANRSAQILCVTQSQAAFQLLADCLPSRLIVAGYSVGEVSAWGVAGLLEPEAVIALAAARAELMNAASGPDDGLAFVRGLTEAQVAALASQHQVDIAIVNPGDMLVVGGVHAQLLAFNEAATAAGAARAALLGVHVASHTRHLAAAVEPFRQLLAQAAVKRPRHGVVLLSGLDGAPVFDAATAADTLAREIDTTLRWRDCLDAAVERGATRFLELGPGRALADMAAKAYPQIPARSLDDFRSREGVRDWLGADA
jgi:[acyl-carrier-protein] S-malonyltransferase